MYDDLVSGDLLSPGLVDHAGSVALTSVPSGWWGAGETNPWVCLRIILGWFIDCMQSLASWIRSEPMVLAVIGIFFVGAVVAMFMRAYHSA